MNDEEEGNDSDSEQAGNMLNDGQRKGKKASPLSGSTIISSRILFSFQYFLTQTERHKV